MGTAGVGADLLSPRWQGTTGLVAGAVGRALTILAAAVMLLWLAAAVGRVLRRRPEALADLGDPRRLPRIATGPAGLLVLTLALSRAFPAGSPGGGAWRPLAWIGIALAVVVAGLFLRSLFDAAVERHDPAPIWFVPTTGLLLGPVALSATAAASPDGLDLGLVSVALLGAGACLAALVAILVLARLVLHHAGGPGDMPTIWVPASPLSVAGLALVATQDALVNAGAPAVGSFAWIVAGGLTAFAALWVVSALPMYLRWLRGRNRPRGPVHWASVFPLTALTAAIELQATLWGVTSLDAAVAVSCAAAVASWIAAACVTGVDFVRWTRGGRGAAAGRASRGHDVRDRDAGRGDDPPQ